MILLLRALLAVAYAGLAHLASTRHDSQLAVLALVVLILIVLVAPLLQRRRGAWLALLLAAAAVAWLAQTPYTHIPLLLVPFAFVALVAWWFARSLLPGRVPLITRIVAALEDTPAQHLDPELRSYARGLTVAWALLLSVIGLSNLTLALIASPAGLLAQMGLQSPVTVTRTQWSWFANLLDYGIMGGFMAVEYLYRKHRFPGRYKNFADFARRVAALGPAFWRDFLR